MPTNGHVSWENNNSTRHRSCRTPETSNPGVPTTKDSEPHAQLPWIMQLQLPCLCTGLCEPHSNPEKQNDKGGTQAHSVQLDWTPKSNNPFEELKEEMEVAARLATPDYTLAFHLDVVEKEGVVKAILYHKRYGERRALKYNSTKCDIVSQGQ